MTGPNGAGPVTLTDAELTLRFTFQKLRDGQAERFDAIWAGALSFARLLVIECPASEELHDAIKALDLVVYQANAAVARRLPVADVPDLRLEPLTKEPAA